MLILVDEISKAEVGSKVMSQLGEVLDQYCECDVLVSSLSPGYVQELLTGSQRPVSYVVLPPLLERGLGRTECYNWADLLLNRIGIDNVNPFKTNMLRKVYIMFLKHSRAQRTSCRHRSIYSFCMEFRC